MERNDGKRPGDLHEKGLLRINRNILIFTFFLVLTFVLWYLNSLSKELDTTISYPVVYTNLPGGETASASLPSRLDITLKGYGYSILRLKLTGSGHPVEVDFAEAGIYRDTAHNQGNYYIVTAPLINKFNVQMPTDCRIMSVKPDTLFSSFSRQ
ncbi:MAG TPA: hypothetical protein PKI12_04950 [Bacteroidales bacterium]|nr:hypothetical protein [Bacteroidales bacterium]